VWAAAGKKENRCSVHFKTGMVIMQHITTCEAWHDILTAVVRGLATGPDDDKLGEKVDRRAECSSQSRGLTPGHNNAAAAISVKR